MRRGRRRYGHVGARGEKHGCAKPQEKANKVGDALLVWRIRTLIFIFSSRE